MSLTRKKPGKELMSCYIAERKILKTQLSSIKQQGKNRERSLTSKLPSSTKHHLDYVSKCMSPLLSFLFEQVFLDEIHSEILSVPNDKSYSLYSSPTKLLKVSSSIIAPVLSELLKLIYLSNRGLTHQSLKLPKLRRYLKVIMELMQLITDLSHYCQMST